MSGRPGRTVVGVSSSPAALAALARGVEEARRRSAELVVVRAFASLGEPLPVEIAEPATIRVLRHRAAAAIERAFASIGGAPYDLDVIRETPVGSTGYALVSLADHPEDLLIVGRDRHRALHRVLHGSVSGYCVAHAACRVLVVPGPRAPVPVPERHALSRTAIRRWASSTEPS